MRCPRFACLSLAALADIAPLGAGGLWDRLAPDVRSRIVAALLGIVLLGLGLFALVRLSSHYALRRLRTEERDSRFGPTHWAARRYLKRRKPDDRRSGE